MSIFLSVHAANVIGPVWSNQCWGGQWSVELFR